MLIGGGNGAATVTPRGNLFKRALRLEWLGQTATSLCWMVSMLFYGIQSTGDWLQFSAASAWLLANIAALANPEAD